VSYLYENKNGIVLDVYVQPKALKSRIVSIYDGALKVAITAPPVDGKANAAIITFIAKVLGIPKSAITISSGKQSRRKKLSIEKISRQEATVIIEKHLS